MSHAFLVSPDSLLMLPECTIFSAGMNAIPLLDDLYGPGPWTVLAPTDEAFSRLSTRAMDALVGGPAPLTELIQTHVARNRVASRDLAGMGWLRTLGGDDLTADVFGDVMLIDRAQIVRPDLEWACGVAHVIDRVLLARSTLIGRGSGAVDGLVRPAVLPGDTTQQEPLEERVIVACDPVGGLRQWLGPPHSRGRTGCRLDQVAHESCLTMSVQYVNEDVFYEPTGFPSL
jgi:hypothetical protein